MGNVLPAPPADRASLEAELEECLRRGREGSAAVQEILREAQECQPGKKLSMSTPDIQELLKRVAWLQDCELRLRGQLAQLDRRSKKSLQALPDEEGHLVPWRVSAAAVASATLLYMLVSFHLPVGRQLFLCGLVAAASLCSQLSQAKEARSSGDHVASIAGGAARLFGKAAGAFGMVAVIPSCVNFFFPSTTLSSLTSAVSVCVYVMPMLYQLSKEKAQMKLLEAAAVKENTRQKTLRPPSHKGQVQKKKKKRH